MTATMDKDAPAGKDAALAAPPAKKKGKRKKILIAVGLVVVLGVGAKYEMGGSAKSSSSVPPAPKPGPLVPLDAVTVNLSGGHYLRIGITLQFTSKVSATAPPDGAAATDQLILYFTGQDSATLTTPTELTTAKKDLEAKIAAAYPDDPLFDILFTSFVVQ